MPETTSLLPPTALPLTEDARIEDEGGRPRVRYRLAIPYYGWFWRPLVARRAREIEEAVSAGQPLPSGTPWWAPPVPQDVDATTAVACICLISGVWSYAGGTGGLLTQTLPYAADVYDVGDSALATGLAVVRAGVLLALAFGLLADKVGRRRFVVTAALAHCLFAAVIGLAPSFAAYVGAQVALRCLDTALGIGLAVLAVESVPAANRAITLSLVLFANGVGVALAVSSLPIAAQGRAGFAAVYALQLLGIPLILDAGRRLAESPRYLAHARERHGYGELLRPPYRRRLALVGGSAFLSAAFVAPGVELFNRYLDKVHGFSSYEIVIFLAVTGLPAVAGVVVGGRAADLIGRKPVGVPLVAASALAYAGFYVASGFWLWPLALAGNLLGGIGGAALAPYSSELFPTRVRAGANTAVTAIAVAGSAIGLGAAAVLADPLGVGHAIAVLAVLPLAGVTIVALGFPETARRRLEDTAAEAPPRAAADFS